MGSQICSAAKTTANETSLFMNTNQIASESPFFLPLVIGLMLAWTVSRKLRKSNHHQLQAPSLKSNYSQTNRGGLARKQEFLSRIGSKYGYKDTPGGWIDDWRPREFPKLLRPYSEDKNIPTAATEEEVYLDYAGSALPTKSQLQSIYTSTEILANPHSSGPAASRTLLGINQVKQRILHHLNAMPGRFASMKQPPVGSKPLDSHSGYEPLFTSGATESIRIIAERFPWQPRCPSCGYQSIFLYAQNSHTSVVGMRELAIQYGARFVCRTIEEILSMTKDDFLSLQSETACSRESEECCCSRTPNLLAFPAECNFGGRRPNVSAILSTARKSGWYTLLDIAKAACTAPISLREWNPDFCCLSFYKLFGEPSGLGALLVKRSSVSVLSSNKQRRHFLGGGSVNILLPKRDFAIPRSEPTPLASFRGGTDHFRGILQLNHGFDELERLGGMCRIHEHATCLARELTRQLRKLRHGNGRKAVVLYSEESDVSGPTVAFNIRRDDGSFVGYNEVSKLAGLHHPPMQFRTGCFCNPGACQQALGFTDDEAIDNYETAGHVCGDHIDLVRGSPTGAIRISFGKDSLWEDMDSFVMFVEKTFVNRRPRGTSTRNKSSTPAKVRVSEVYVFPIKSCAAQRVKKWRIELPSGKLVHDREFALVDASGTAMRLQSYPKLGMIKPSIDMESETLTVSAPGQDDIILSLTTAEHQDMESDVVKVCGNKCGGRLWGDYEVSVWFSSFLGVQCWLARFYDGDYQLPCSTKSPLACSPRTSFANEQPLLLISENAVAALNQVLAEQNQTMVGSKHFRPNLVVRSMTEDLCHIEDEWEGLCLSNKTEVKFQVKGTCARCTMIDFDPTTGNKGKTLSCLAKYRRQNGRITFGIFLRAVLEDSKNDHFWILEGDELTSL